MLVENTRTPLELSLVVPVYNGASLVQARMEAAKDYLARQPFACELIVVDDGSTDDTYRLACESAEGVPGVTVLRGIRNRGKGARIGATFHGAMGRYLAFTDVDGAYPVEELGKLVEELRRGADVAIACRVLPESRYLISPAFFRYLYTRHLMGRFFNLLTRILLVPGIWDTQAGMKAFRRDAAARLFSRQTLHRFSFDVEILFLARQFRLQIAQVPVDFGYFREPTTVRFVRDSVSMMLDLLRIRRNHLLGRYRKPRSQFVHTDVQQPLADGSEKG